MAPGKIRSQQKPYKGRGQKVRTENITVSAPQHANEGHAHSAKGRELQRRLQQTKRLRVLGKKGKPTKTGKNKKTSVINWRIRTQK